MFTYLMRWKHIKSVFLRNYSSGNIRVRFAPSPTGYLHLGGLRTALYNYLFAKANNGTFVLRIEDTDQTRVINGAAKQLEDDLVWSGIEIDEGPSQGGNFGSYCQSERLSIYKTSINKLLENGTAYRCFCTDKRLQLLRREALKAQQIPKYDNKCRHLSSEEVQSRIDQGHPSCVRFKISDKEEAFDDLIYGTVSYNISLNEGDPVIMKTDGFPTYHFANVVDDHLMNITHVLRGVEWQISTTKHMLLYRAFGWEPPMYGHLPLLMNADGTKLSKRQGDIRISHYRENGILPLALCNFIAHSGGGFAKDLERHLKPKCYTLKELSAQFNLLQINSHSGKLMTDRLLEFNKLAIKRFLEQDDTEKELIVQVKQLLQKTFPERNHPRNCSLIWQDIPLTRYDITLVIYWYFVSERLSCRFNNLLRTVLSYADSFERKDDYIKNLLHWSSHRIDKITDLVSKNLKFIWVLPDQLTLSEEDIRIVEQLKRKLESEEDFEKNKINTILKSFSEANQLKYSNFMKLLRSILSGLKEGPGVADMVEILGKENTLKRLDFVIRNTTTVKR